MKKETIKCTIQCTVYNTKDKLRDFVVSRKTDQKCRLITEVSNGLELERGKRNKRRLKVHAFPSNATLNLIQYTQHDSNPPKFKTLES
jgi:hypothetical protein